MNYSNPLYNGHHWDQDLVSEIEIVCYKAAIIFRNSYSPGLQILTVIIGCL